ncbi:HBL301Cp [Eremothecium sinecaudum]|uniref:HBL301Cp n=1 Tax=Eremothecium sinecaudum TaxID=45286 RepID=A0A120K0S1_9SACH|nr:HBL301Cp [Eremothecium sinecaudum]AMD18601.1 HBL301Cp [Eremothecium sinecaudum]
MSSPLRTLPRLIESYPRAVFIANRRVLSLGINRTYSSNTVEERYKAKLLEKAKQKGFQSIEDLKAKLKADIQSKKAEFNKIDPLKELHDYEQRSKMMKNNAKVNSRGPIDPSKPQQPYKTLNSFMDVDKIRSLSKQEVEFLWRARWMNKENTLNAVVPVDVFERMSTYAKANPAFVLPLPTEVKASEEDKTEDQGMEMHYIQWLFVGPNTVHCIMTSLAEFKLHKEFSRPHTTLQFHTELAKEKKVVFMNGQVEKDSNVSLPDAQLLLLNVQRFYGAMGDSSAASKMRLKLLSDFTNGSPDFNVDSLISLAQSMEN